MNFIIVQFPVILMSIAYALGIFISNYSSDIRGNVSFFVSFGILILVSMLEVFLKRRDGFKTFFMLSSITLFSFFINSIRVHKFYEGDKVINSEVIITKLFSSTKSYQNCIVKDVYTSHKYLAQLKLRDTNNYKVGTKLVVIGSTKRLSGLAVPYNFNFSEYLKVRNVSSRLVINNYIENYENNNISISIENSIDKNKLSDTSKGLMKALVLGRKEGIPDELLESFSDSGIMHLLALSGLHIGILTVILNFLLKPIKLFRKGKLLRSIIIVLMLWIYAYITGFSSSIVRATIMFSIIVIGNGMRREVNIFNSLAISALVLLIINPSYLFDVGFQLSFSAVIGIVWIFPLLNKLWRPRYKVIRYLWRLLLVSISAQLTTFPFTVYYFHKFSGLFFIANIIEIPLITVLLGLSYLILASMLLGINVNIVNYIYNKTVVIIEWFSLKISNIESMILDDIFIDQIMVLLLLVLIISTIVFIQHKRVKYLYSVLIAVIFIQVSSILKIEETSSKQILIIAKNEVIIQDGYSYMTNYNEGSKLFVNYTLANNLNTNPSIIDDVFKFDNNYYWIIGENLKTNPITDNHIIIVDKQSKSNPVKVVNKNTVGVIYSGYENSINRIRWEYFCSRNDIVFVDTNEELFLLDKG